MAAPPRRTAWRSASEAQSAVLRLLELDMRRSCGISLAWYDVLVHLSEGGGMRRMNELAECLVLSRSWLTRRILAMEEAGVVHRCSAEDDARGVCAALTPEGRRLYRKAARTHARAVDRHFLGHLDPAEVTVIQASFDRVAAAARGALHPPG